MNPAAAKGCAVNALNIILTWASYLDAYSHPRLSALTTDQSRDSLHVINNKKYKMIK